MKANKVEPWRKKSPQNERKQSETNAEKLNKSKQKKDTLNVLITALGSWEKPVPRGF